MFISAKVKKNFSLADFIYLVIWRVPPTDLTGTAVLNYETKTGLLLVIQKMTGAIYTPGQSLGPEFAASSPIYYVKNIPTLIIHGTADRTVPYSQAVDLDKMLTTKNITHKLITIPGADHDCNINVPMTRAMIYKEIVAWAWKYGK